MTKAKAATRKRKVRGKDWHAWAWKAGRTWHKPGELFYFAHANRPRRGALGSKPMETGKWVKVKFVEVKP